MLLWEPLQHDRYRIHSLGMLGAEVSVRGIVDILQLMAVLLCNAFVVFFLVLSNGVV